MQNFTHLHVHTYFSFLDGFGSPQSRAKKAKELGMNAIAITDHNHVAGCYEFQKACQDEGMKPILGAELYWTWDTSILSLDSDKRKEMATERAICDGVVITEKMKKKDINSLIAPYEYDTTQYHIIILAKNQTGWKNLIKLQSEAAQQCTYNGRFLCDDNLLKKYREGLIFSTACIGNTAARKITEGDSVAAFERLQAWHDIFQNDFYIEIQPLNIPEQRVVNLALLKYAEENNINVIATNDVHWTNKEDYDDHDTLLCIGIGKKKEDVDRLKYSNDFWIKSYDEMLDSFSTQADAMIDELEDFDESDKEAYMNKIVQALENTNFIANQIEEIKIGSSVPVLPKIEVPENTTPEKYFRKNSFISLYKYYSENKDINLSQYEKRLNEELDIINSKGYAPYMLIVKDFIDYCDKNDIPVGPGRGSAAGSLALFLNNMTKVVDPIKDNLLFFRFLTKDRTALPDIDSDISYLGRQKVLNYLREKYGTKSVSHIGTFTYMGVKNGLKDCGRVLNIPFEDMNAITKKIDEWFEDPSLKFQKIDKLKDVDTEADQLIYQQFKELENRYPELFRLARAFEGTPRNMGIHASGILVTPGDVTDYVPTRVDKEGSTVCLFTGVDLEKLNLVDFCQV